MFFQEKRVMQKLTLVPTRDVNIYPCTFPPILHLLTELRGATHIHFLGWHYIYMNFYFKLLSEIIGINNNVNKVKCLISY